jgi:hypothetical protein
VDGELWERQVIHLLEDINLRVMDDIMPLWTIKCDKFDNPFALG